MSTQHRKQIVPSSHTVSTVYLDDYNSLAQFGSWSLKHTRKSCTEMLCHRSAVRKLTGWSKHRWFRKPCYKGLIQRLMRAGYACHKISFMLAIYVSMEKVLLPSNALRRVWLMRRNTLRWELLVLEWPCCNWREAREKSWCCSGNINSEFVSSQWWFQNLM